MINEIKKLREKAKQDGNPVLRDKSFELLLEVVEKKQPARILEIGTNVGLTGIAMLLVSKNSKLTSLEIDENVAKIAQANYKHFGVEERAKIFKGDCSEIIPVLTGKYDFIFLDGPKGHYFEYVQNLLSVLNVGGILFADNVLFRGYVNSKEKTPKKYNTTRFSMEKFLDYVTNNKGLKTQVIDLEDGVSITEKLW